MPRTQTIQLLNERQKPALSWRAVVLVVNISHSPQPLYSSQLVHTVARF